MWVKAQSTRRKAQVSTVRTCKTSNGQTSCDLNCVSQNCEADMLTARTPCCQPAETIKRVSVNLKCGGNVMRRKYKLCIKSPRLGVRSKMFDFEAHMLTIFCQSVCIYLYLYLPARP